MRFQKFSEEELTRANLIDPGQYKFRVAEAKDKISKNGSEMIELKLAVTDIEGKERTIFCYLLEAMPHLVKHFCDTTGLEMKYNDGTLLAIDCERKQGYVEIAIGKGKDKNGNDINRNNVKDFIMTEKYKEPEKEFKDCDDIPF